MQCGLNILTVMRSEGALEDPLEACMMPAIQARRKAGRGSHLSETIVKLSLGAGRVIEMVQHTVPIVLLGHLFDRYLSADPSSPRLTASTRDEGVQERTICQYFCIAACTAGRSVRSRLFSEPSKLLMPVTSCK